MAVIVNGDGILTGISSLATSLTDITSGRGTVTGVATVGTLQLGAGVSISSPRSQQAAIFTNNTEFLTVDDAGRVGIGTITPNSDAHPENEKKINVGFITAKSVAGDIDARNVVVAGVGTFTDDVKFIGALSGRDLQWDKSDNALEFLDNTSAFFGTGNDLQIYHNSGNNNSYITESGSGALIIGGTDLYLQDVASGTGHYYVICATGGRVQLNYDNSEKFRTTSSGITVSSDNSVGSILKGVTRFTPNDSTTVKVMWDETGFSGAGHFQAKDGVAFTAGDSSDLKIYHDGSHSNIINTTGVLKVRGAAGQSITFRNGDDSANVAVFNVDDATHLYYDSAHKFSTTSGGVKTIGQAEIDGNCFPYSDNNSDLGLSANRWQDLYLSGNIYLGGTGSANALADYEEGTYTATMTVSSGTLSVINNTLSYVKIGDICHVTGRLYPSLSSSGDMGEFYFSLPFAARGSNTGQVQYEQGFILHTFRATEDTSSTTGANRSTRNFRIVASSSVARMIAQNDGNYGTFGATNPHMLATFTYQTN